MPREILEEKVFLDIVPKAIHCRVKRTKDVVKLKLRTKRVLYTFKTDPLSAERLLKAVTCDIIEL